MNLGPRTITFTELGQHEEIHLDGWQVIDQVQASLREVQQEIKDRRRRSRGVRNTWKSRKMARKLVVHVSGGKGRVRSRVVVSHRKSIHLAAHSKTDFNGRLMRSQLANHSEMHHLPFPNKMTIARQFYLVTPESLSIF